MSVTTPHPQDEPWARTPPQHRQPAGTVPGDHPQTPAAPSSWGGTPSPAGTRADAPENPVGAPIRPPVPPPADVSVDGCADASVESPRHPRCAAAPDDDPWLDGAAGRLVRPYTVSNGRTRPVMALDLLARLHATGTAPLGYLTPEHRHALALCRTPVSVVEISGRLGLPLAITKVLLGDLLDCGSLTVEAPAYYDDPVDRSLLEAVLDGLRRRL